MHAGFAQPASSDTKGVDIGHLNEGLISTPEEFLGKERHNVHMLVLNLSLVRAVKVNVLDIASMRPIP
jgi:hypothetical protein